VTISTCEYRINEFAFVAISNCTAFNISAERGWNDFNFSINRGLVSEGSAAFNFWAKEYDSSVFDYPVLWVMMVVMLVCFLVGSRIGIFFIFGGIAGVVVGLQLVAFSVWLGVTFSICVLLASLMMLFMDSK